MAGRKPTSALGRFWDKVSAGGPADCWTWNGARNHRGYGQFVPSPGCKMPAHRFAWEVANAVEVPLGMEIDHTCGQKPCVNPAHLRPLDHRTNTAEGWARAKAGLKPDVIPSQPYRVTVEQSRAFRRCTHCDAPTNRRGTLCQACYRYQWRTGRPRPIDRIVAANVRRLEQRMEAEAWGLPRRSQRSA